MQTMEIEKIRESLNQAFLILNESPVNDPESRSFEDAVYLLNIVAESIKFIRASYEDIDHEVQVILKNLQRMEEVVQEKIENPYSQRDFITLGRTYA